MLLYTCQSRNVYDIIVNEGHYAADIKKADWANRGGYFAATYRWLADAFANKIECPAEASCPIWAYDYDFDYSDSGEDGKDYVYLTLDIPDDAVSFIDGYKWGEIVCGGYVYPEDLDDETYDDIKKMSFAARSENWSQVFNVEEDPEAIFWSIDKSQVKDAVFYTCHIEQNHYDKDEEDE